MKELSQEKRARQLALGLPGTILRNVKLSFSPSNQVLFVHFMVDSEGLQIPQLFFRELKTSTYTNALALVEEPLGLEPLPKIPGIASHAIGDGGIVYCLVFVYGMAANGMLGGTAEAVVRMDPVSKQVDVWSREEFSRQAVVPVDVIGASNDAIYMRAGIRVQGEGQAHGLEYKVLKMRWEGRRVEVLAELQDVFF